MHIDFRKECAQCKQLHKMGVLAWSLTSFGLILDRASLWLTEEESAEAIDFGLLYIQLYMHMATEAWEQKRPRYPLSPKAENTFVSMRNNTAHVRRQPVEPEVHQLLE